MNSIRIGSNIIGGVISDAYSNLGGVPLWFKKDFRGGSGWNRRSGLCGKYSGSDSKRGGEQRCNENAPEGALAHRRIYTVHEK